MTNREKAFRHISREAIRSIKAAHPHATLWVESDGEDLCEATTSESALQEYLHSVDEAFLYVALPCGIVSFVRFSWVNNPGECIVDYGLSIEAVMKRTLATAERYDLASTKTAAPATIPATIPATMNGHPVISAHHTPAGVAMREGHVILVDRGEHAHGRYVTAWVGLGDKCWCWGRYFNNRTDADADFYSRAASGC